MIDILGLPGVDCGHPWIILDCLKMSTMPQSLCLSICIDQRHTDHPRQSEDVHHSPTRASEYLHTPTCHPGWFGNLKCTQILRHRGWHKWHPWTVQDGLDISGVCRYSDTGVGAWWTSSDWSGYLKCMRILRCRGGHPRTLRDGLGVSGVCRYTDTAVGECWTFLKCPECLQNFQHERILTIHNIEWCKMDYCLGLYTLDIQGECKIVLWSTRLPSFFPTCMRTNTWFEVLLRSACQNKAIFQFSIIQCH